MDLQRPLLTPAQVAAILGVEEDTLARWRCTKRYPLAWVKVGSRCAYRTEDVEAFIERRRVSPADASE